MSAFTLALVASFFVSLISLIGIIFIFIKKNFLQKITVILVSFAIGALLGDSIIHLLPESFQQLGFNLSTSLLVILGIIIFFILEKIIHWQHCHDVECWNNHKAVISLNLVGDSVHNFMDGVIIAASFSINPAIGLATTLAVILHEIPQEIGNFGIFIHHGLSVTKALIYNFISALFSILGVFLTFALGSTLNNFSVYLLPVTAGGFIYLAASDLIPELNRHNSKISHSLVQLIFILLGIGVMSILAILE